MIPLIFLTSDSEEYRSCIESKPCQHDGEDLKKLAKSDYMKTMQCRVKRHMECIKTETEHHEKVYYLPPNVIELCICRSGTKS